MSRPRYQKGSVALKLPNMKTSADLVRFIRQQRKHVWKMMRTEAEAYLASGDVEGFFSCVDSAEQTAKLIEYAAVFREKGLLEKAFLIAYTSQKEHMNGKDGWFYYATLRSLDKTRLLAASETLPARIGDTLTIYRGVSHHSANGKNIRNISWTLSRKTARFFAHRWDDSADKEKGKVYKTVIARADVLAYIHKTGRGEQEVLVLLPPTQPIREVLTR